jgi:hypothetical protein
VRFTGRWPEYKSEFDLAFSDFVEAYNPRVEAHSNDVNIVRTEPCVAFYPSANRNGSWIMWNINTKTYVRRTQWRKLPFSETLINIMNDIVGGAGITLAGVQIDGDVEEFDEAIGPSLHQPNDEEANIPTAEEDAVRDMELEEPPELTDQYHDDSDSEYGEEEPEELLGDQDNECDESEDEVELGELLEELGMSTDKPKEQQPRVLRRSSRETAGKQRYDTAFNWNLMNLSVSAAIKNFGDVAK